MGIIGMVSLGLSMMSLSGDGNGFRAKHGDGLRLTLASNLHFAKAVMELGFGHKEETGAGDVHGA